MTRAERQALYTCNVNDFIERNFKSFQSDNVKDYIDKSIAYILRYGLDGKKTPAAVLRNLIYEAKNQVALVVAKKQLANNPNDLTNMNSINDLEIKQFLSNPVDYIVAKVNDEEYYNNSIKPSKIEGLNDLENKGYIRAFDNNKQSVIDIISTDAFKVRYNGNENKNLQAKNVISALEQKLPETTIDNELSRLKGKFFERFFRRTSNEYKNFKKALKHFKDTKEVISKKTNKPKIVPKYEGHGDRKALEEAAFKYLRHKFPNLNEGQLPKSEELERLDPTGKARAELCLKVIESLNEAKQADKLVTAVRDLNLNVNNPNKNNIEPENVVDNNINKNVIIENSNEIKIDDSKKKSGLKSSLSNKDKPKRKVRFDVGRNAPKLTKTKGGSGRVPLKPGIVQMKEEKKKIREVEEIMEEAQLSKEIMEDAKKVAPDNKEFLDDLKKDTEEKVVVNKDEIIDTSSKNVELELDDSK